MRGVITDGGNAIHLGDAPKEVRVVRQDGSAVPLSNRHAGTVQGQSGSAAGPDFVGRDSICRIDIVRHIEYRADIGCESLQLEYFTVGQFASKGYAGAVGPRPNLLPVGLVALFEFFGKCL